MTDQFTHFISQAFTPRFLMLALIAVLVMMPELALAADGDTDALPYEAGLAKFQKSIQGPVPFAISLVGIVACGAMLIFGGEISGFMRTMIFIVLVAAVIVQAGSLVRMLGGNAKYDQSESNSTSQHHDIGRGFV